MSAVKPSDVTISDYGRRVKFAYEGEEYIWHGSRVGYWQEHGETEVPAAVKEAKAAYFG